MYVYLWPVMHAVMEYSGVNIEMRAESATGILVALA